MCVCLAAVPSVKGGLSIMAEERGAPAAPCGGVSLPRKISIGGGGGGQLLCERVVNKRHVVSEQSASISHGGRVAKRGGLKEGKISLPPSSSSSSCNFT